MIKSAEDSVELSRKAENEELREDSILYSIITTQTITTLFVDWASNPKLSVILKTF